MIFLPIVERELRVAARKRSTVWFRVLAALVALMIGAGFLMMSLAVGVSTSRFGGGLFGTLTWLALAAALAAGLFFTADSLSEEKREGTLGFLFLTDLRGYDVVGGKLLATSLRGSYALLALFPVLAITLIMGGVTGIQFWRSALALVNALFCSLAAGLFVSSFCRDSQRAMGGTFLLLLLACAGGPLADSILAALGRAGFRSFFSLTSPVYVFWAASAWGKTNYWTGLLASHVLGWAWFTLACLLVPHTWQDRARKIPSSTRILSYSWTYGGASARAVRRRKLIDLNPVLWLVSRERWQGIALWVLTLLVLGPFVTILMTLPSTVWIIWAQVSWLVLVVLYLWTASQASRFFVEARRSGLMELLLVTPLTSKDIVFGQWQALLRMFGLPVVLLLLVQFSGTLLSQHASIGMMAGTAGGYAPSLALNILSATVGGFSVIANLVAVMWFGMWMGLISKNGSVATLKTVVLVEVLPWLGLSIVSTTLAGLLMFSRVFAGGASSGTMVLGFPLVMTGLFAVLSLAKDAAFFIWARNRLFSSFRAAAARLPATSSRSAAVSGSVLSPLPPAIPAK
jgi:ABC-type transport system involved in cytochrome c biogenesis permease component